MEPISGCGIKYLREIIIGIYAEMFLTPPEKFFAPFWVGPYW